MIRPVRSRPSGNRAGKLINKFNNFRPTRYDHTGHLQCFDSRLWYDAFRIYSDTAALFDRLMQELNLQTRGGQLRSVLLFDAIQFGIDSNAIKRVIERLVERMVFL